MRENTESCREFKNLLEKWIKIVTLVNSCDVNRIKVKVKKVLCNDANLEWRHAVHKTSVSKKIMVEDSKRYNIVTMRKRHKTVSQRCSETLREMLSLVTAGLMIRLQCPLS